MNAQERLARSQQASAKVSKLLNKRMQLANEKLSQRIGQAFAGNPLAAGSAALGRTL